MAKLQVKQYNFKPGLSYLSNARPNAYDLILANKTFLKKEVIGFLNEQVLDSTKCARDLGYLIDAVGYDITLGTNYNSLFLGLAEYNSLEVTPTVLRTIARVRDEIPARVILNATALTRSNAFFNEVIDIAQNGRNAANPVSFTNPSNATASRIAAKDRLVANKDFLAAEVNAWVGVTYPSHNHDVSKCTRDVKYAIDALCYDILYGGNSATYDQARFFFYFDSANNPGIDPTHRLQTVAAYGRLKTIVSEVVRGISVTKTTTGTTPNNLNQSISGANADAGDATILQNLVQITADVVAATTRTAADAVLAGITKTFPSVTWADGDLQLAKTGIDSNKNNIINFVNAFASYIFNTEKCERDLGYVLDAYLFDLRYGGNEETREVAAKYWIGDVPQIDGNRIVEIEAHLFLRDLINTNILTNTQADTYQVVVSQVIDLTKTAESSSTTIITNLAGILTSVIEFGTTVLPLLITGVGRIKFPKKYEQSQILLITNTTKNEIIYDFSDPGAGGVWEFIRDESDIFPRILEAAQGYTQLTFFYNTSNHSETDSIQIFVDVAELKTRPYDFGTDAMERMRMAAPQAMLDADFEYGLQPTKWQTIATSRGYPSTYEIPGSDLLVTTVSTDASTSTNSIGPSLITVTTVSPHFLSVGIPISIKALASSITGFSRAEGTFLVNSIINSNSFTYYSKSRVGNINGEVLSTTYTQLRVAGFYTGASIGSPTFTVFSQGASGNSTVSLLSAQGENTIAFTGTAPSVGDPVVSTTSRFFATSSGTSMIVTAVNIGSIAVGHRLTGGSIPAGTFIVSQQTGTSGGPGTYITSVPTSLLASTQVTGSSFSLGTQVTAVRGSGGPTVTAYANQNVEVGATSFNLIDASGISVGQGIDNGSGRIQEISSISGNTVSFLSARTTRIIGSNASYTNLASTSITGNGTGLIISLSSNGSDQFSTVSVDFGGENYSVNDTIKILGTDLEYYTDTKLLAHFNGTNNATSGDGFLNIANGEVATVSGNASISSAASVFGGTSVRFFNTVVGTAGEVSNDHITFAPSGDYNIFGNFVIEFNFIPITLSSTRDSIILDRRLAEPESSITIGVDDASCLFVYIDGGKVIQGTTVLTATDTYHIALSRFNGELKLWLNGNQEGSTYNDFTNYLADRPVRLGADFDGENGIRGYIDELRINTGVANIYVNPFTPPVSEFGEDIVGASPANDVTFKVASIGPSGEVLTVNQFTGTAPVSNKLFLRNSSGTLQTPVGSGASFNLSRINGAYTGLSIATAGNGYLPNNLIKIDQSLLDGAGDDSRSVILRVISSSVTGQIQSISLVSGTPISTGTPIEIFSTFDINDALVADLPATSTFSFSAIAKITVTFPTGHGLIPGSGVSISVTSGGVNHSLLNGPAFIEEVPNKQSFRFTVRSSGNIATSPPITGVVYPRTDAFFLHRPFDGGVLLSTGSPSHGAQAIRMSKKYIRYQSGKGAMYTTGALFAPSYDIRSMSADGIAVNSVITVVVDDNDHGLQIGSGIRISGAVTVGYDGDYSVVELVDERVFRIRANTQLGSTSPEIGSSCQMAHISWHGAFVRAGAFDDQNGIFFEYDGQELAVVRRSATFQLAGTVSINADSNLVTGSNTRFTEQLIEGDRVVIRGMTHVISDIINNNSMTVNPDFRGFTNVTNAKLCLIKDYRIPQSEWNLDKCDGTGPSGYILDVTKMQMIGLQYSWYGAGFIDWMFRGPNGDYVFAHRLRGNNLNTEAYMRTGNLPVRYEVLNEGARSPLVSEISSTASSMTVKEGKYFPEAGVVYVENELISYTSKSGNSLGGLTRAAPYVNFSAGSQRTFTAGPAATHPVGSGVILISTTASPLISHWGSAYLMDGRFDTDRGYIFNYQITNITVTNIKTTAFAIRLAPSVSNAITGDLGERELLNRAQLLLNSLEVVGGTSASIDSFIIEGVLNPLNYPESPASITWFSLTSTAQGGQPSFAQIANGSSITFAGSGSQAANPTQNFATTPAIRLRQAVFTSSTVNLVRLGWVVSSTAGIQPGTVVERIQVNTPSINQTTITISKDVTAGPGVTITFASPQFAQPGEQVFAFAAPQGSREVLDLSELKELTSTAIGGRGTFPNGPDVLAINIYSTGSTPVIANLILRWGEAQA